MGSTLVAVWHGVFWWCRFSWRRRARVMVQLKHPNPFLNQHQRKQERPSLTSGLEHLWTG